MHGDAVEKPGREQIAGCCRGPIAAEHRAEAANHSEEDAGGAGRDQKQVCPQPLDQVGARRAAAVDDEGRKRFVKDDGQNEYGREDYELSAGERRDQDRDEGKRLAAQRGLDERTLHREHGPHKGGVGDGVVAEHVAEGEPRDTHAQRSDRIAGQLRCTGLARQQVSRDRSAGHEHGVKPVGCLERVAGVQQAIERR